MDFKEKERVAALLLLLVPPSRQPDLNRFDRWGEGNAKAVQKNHHQKETSQKKKAQEDYAQERQAGLLMSVVVSRETLETASPETRLLLIYDMIADQSNLLAGHIEAQNKSCERRYHEYDKRFVKIERRKSLNLGISVVGSFLGGFSAMLVKFKFWDI